MPPPLDDDFNDLTLPGEPPLSVRTTWTLLLYLTSGAEGCVGGETVFYPHDRKSAREEIAVPLETGMALLHKHGDDCLLVSYPEVTLSSRPVKDMTFNCDIFGVPDANPAHLARRSRGDSGREMGLANGPLHQAMNPGSSSFCNRYTEYMPSQ